MYKGKSVVGIIPARGGSKGLPGKNIRQLCGKPLIAWSIEHAKLSRVIDRCIVSTDDPKIADIAIKCGGDVPFLRPAELAADETSTIQTLDHSLMYLENIGENYDILTLLEPTSPLRDPGDIDASVAKLVETLDAESVVGISRVKCTHPDFLMKMSHNGFLQSYVGSVGAAKRRQDTDELYFLEGSVYTSYVDALRKHTSFYHEKTVGYPVPFWKSLEIDDLADFIAVEAFLTAKIAGVLHE